MVEKKTEREILDQMVDEQEMLEFFEKNHEAEVEMGKMKILHAYHSLIDGIDKVFKNCTKGMTKQQIKEWQEENEEGEDAVWEQSFDVMVSEIEQKYNYKIDIEVDDYFINITYHTKFFWIKYDITLSSKKPKLSEMEFEIELDNEAHFLIDLCNKLILNQQEDD